MNPTTYALLLFAHLAGAAFWVGGMATMHLAVRPAAAAVLEPPLRLPFMVAALGRFLRGVDVALAALWISGMAMFMAIGGFRGAHWRIHAMFTLALVMTAVYGYIRGRAFPRLRRAAAERQWPQAGAHLGQVRQLVALNLALGTLVFAVALVGRAA
ncbi:MAG TPA: CopD family protein [Pseudorhodoferax sp.]|nr:CopD family protein [Pseudorhodoferax sp.]